LTKDQVRKIDETFVETHLAKRLDEAGVSLPAAPTGPAGIFGETGVAGQMKEVAKTFVNEAIDSNGKPTHQLSPENQKLGTEMKVATETAIAEERLKNLLAKPIEHFRESRRRMEEIAEQIAVIAKESSFDKKGFTAELEKVRDALTAIKQKLDDLS
jgi:hypothetical protein